MRLHDQYRLTRVINARGTFTPLGVSRSSPGVAQAVAGALQEFFVIDELQAAASERIAAYASAEAAAVTHCVSAAITLSIAAVMTGGEPARVAALPDTSGMPNRVVLPAGHAIDYGHPIVQDIRLAGAVPVLAGTGQSCAANDLEQALAAPGTACLLLVSSRLTKGAAPDFGQAVAIAHRHGIPVIVDGAAQDMRIGALLATGADLVLASAHKYLASPTAGLIIGKRDLVMAARAQEKGIGRAMKATKEAIVGVLKALEERNCIDVDAWRRRQEEKVADFVRRVNDLPGVRPHSVPDPAGMPFPRAVLLMAADGPGIAAREVARRLQAGTPPIWVMDHNAAQGELVLELVALEDAEIDVIVERLHAILA